ncbi:deoxyribonuclease IV [Virgibacillus sp. 179-BFC.A HS]|uniref:Deoxyribonuclease IV n=1 Tax=Tigheibacillus jepli TaxID=3035914 RepID=A0ABU5CMZ7_9BACI|nr:deoxyribonuclease IV [Virgibacillus sp. 179-BFC.A HS]MDY0406825.1 deoxyribonuclease IV [Virgibacillus sp. 179-BFC.A HS]
MKFGCHLSIRNGYLGAAKQALAMQANAFQYFPKNPRSLKVKDFDQRDALECQFFCKEQGLESVGHSPYPTSLTPLDEEKRKAVIDSLLNDLHITEACGSIGIVVHFGKEVGHGNPLASYQLMISMLNQILQQWEGNAKILLENRAGVPGSIGTTLEELVQVRNLCDYPEKIGFCLDTCHAFASGLWDGENWDELVEKAKKLDYFSELKAIHLNNCKYPTRLGKDRHAPIFGSNGYIRLNQFDQVIQTPQLQDIPFILETPKEIIPHEKEIAMLQEKWG